MHAPHLPLANAFLIQHTVFTGLWKPLGIRQERQRHSTPPVSLKLHVLTQRCTKMATVPMLGAINLPNFLNTTKTNMTFDKMLHINLQNSVKYQTFPRYFCRLSAQGLLRQTFYSLQYFPCSCTFTSCSRLVYKLKWVCITSSYTITQKSTLPIIKLHCNDVTHFPTLRYPNWDRLQVSCWQSHLNRQEHKSAFTEKLSHRISTIQRLCPASEWHVCSRNITYMSQSYACAALWPVLTIAAPSEHYIWRRCLLRAGAKGVQTVKGIISAVARWGEGIAAFRVPAVYIAAVTNAALWALNILRFLHGSTAGTSS